MSRQVKRARRARTNDKERARGYLVIARRHLRLAAEAAPTDEAVQAAMVQVGAALTALRG